jgi:quinol monooxygenase YgiN
VSLTIRIVPPIVPHFSFFFTFQQKFFLDLNPSQRYFPLAQPSSIAPTDCFTHSPQETLMIARIITCNVTPAKVPEFRALLNTTVIPKVQCQPGFVENVESLDPVSGHFSCTTLWQSRTDVDNYDNSVFPEIAAKISPLLSGNPSVQTLPVENSSTQHVRAAAAAAR